MRTVYFWAKDWKVMTAAIKRHCGVDDGGEKMASCFSSCNSVCWCRKTRIGFPIHASRCGRYYWCCCYSNNLRVNFFVSFFSLKVFKGCGQPRLGKRSATTSEINFESVKFDRAGSGGSGTGGANVRPTTAAGTSLDRLVRDIKQKVGFQAISSLSLSLLFFKFKFILPLRLLPYDFSVGMCVALSGGGSFATPDFFLFGDISGWVQSTRIVKETHTHSSDSLN